MSVEPEQNRGLKVDMTAQYEVDANIAWRKIGGEGFLITRDGSMTHRLNPTGTRVFELMSDGKTGDDVVKLLASEFDGAADDIRRDVAELVATLISRRIFVKKDSPCR